MLNQNSFLPVLCAIQVMCAFGLGMTCSAEEVWLEDATAAIEKAAEEDKDLLLLYTGSDWCPPCMKLERNILSKEKFQTKISEHFVLVKFDFPSETQQDQKLVEQNQEWAKKYGIEGYPTIYLVDQALKPYAVAGYESSTVEDYLEMLEDARQIRIERDEKLKQAAGQKGLEKARLLDEALGGIQQELVALYYPEIVKEIVELDRQDELGLRTKWNEAQDIEMRKIIMTDMMMIARLEKPERAIEFIDEVLDEVKFPTSDMLEILQIKLNLVRHLNEPDRTDALLDEIINLDGITTGTRERMIVKKIYLMIGSGRDQEALKLIEDSMLEGEQNLHLKLAKGEILYSLDKKQDAISAFDEAMGSARHLPDLLIDLVSAKADVQYELGEQAQALQTLDNFADDAQMPTDLRGEALLHKSLLMRDMGRIRQARLAENRAIEITESSDQRAEMQKMVERLREKFEGE